MPVVMTGSPGGSLGGSTGSSFGSGLAGLTSSPTKMFTPNLEVWAKRAEEDRQIAKERREEYEQLRDMRLAMVSEQSRQSTDKKKKEKEAFAARQKERLEAEKAEKARLREWRRESLEKNKVDRSMDMREGEPGYGPTRWCWPTAHHHPRMTASGDDVSIGFVLGPGAMIESQLLSVTDKSADVAKEMKQRAAPHAARGVLTCPAHAHPRTHAVCSLTR